MQIPLWRFDCIMNGFFLKIKFKWMSEIRLYLILSQTKFLILPLSSYPSLMSVSHPTHGDSAIDRLLTFLQPSHGHSGSLPFPRWASNCVSLLLKAFQGPVSSLDMEPWESRLVCPFSIFQILHPSLTFWACHVKYLWLRQLSPEVTTGLASATNTTFLLYSLHAMVTPSSLLERCPIIL